MIIRACDLETTGKDATDEVIEIGAHDVRDGRVYSTPYWTFVKPAAPIPPSSSAVHHITDADVAPLLLGTKPGASGGPVRPARRRRRGRDHLRRACRSVRATVARSPDHRALDLHLEVRTAPVAGHGKPQAAGAPLCPEPPACRSGPRFAPSPRRARRLCLRLLLLELLKHQTVETLIAWTAEPAIFTKFDFGEHVGKPLSEARNGYFEWMLTKDFSADWQWNARRELQRRANAKVEEAAAVRRAYLDKMLAALPRAATVRDLENWYHGAAPDMGEQGIIVGTDEYDVLIKACGERKKVLLESGQPQFGEVPA
jgi:exodeoxyribonuclease X